MMRVAFGLLTVLALKQDPCANCDEDLAIAYQRCAMEHGNPCALVGQADTAEEGWMAGQVVEGGLGLKKEKHDRCMQCKSMDCSHDTCTVNKKYYSERKMDDTDPDWADKAKEESGWGSF